MTAATPSWGGSASTTGHRTNRRRLREPHQRLPSQARPAVRGPAATQPRGHAGPHVGRNSRGAQGASRGRPASRVPIREGGHVPGQPGSPTAPSPRGEGPGGKQLSPGAATGHGSGLSKGRNKTKQSKTEQAAAPWARLNPEPRMRQHPCCRPWRQPPGRGARGLAVPRPRDQPPHTRTGAGDMLASELSHGCPGQGASNTAPGPPSISPAPPSAHRSVRGLWRHSGQRPKANALSNPGHLPASCPQVLPGLCTCRPLLATLSSQLSPPPRSLRLLAARALSLQDLCSKSLCSRSTCWRRPLCPPGAGPAGRCARGVCVGETGFSRPAGQSLRLQPWPGRRGLLCPQHRLPATRPGVWEAGWGQARGNPGPHGGSGHSTPGPTPPQKDTEENTRAELHAPTAPPCGHCAPHEHAGSSL